MISSVPDPTTLAAMMGSLRQCSDGESARIADGFPALLDALRGIPVLGLPTPVRVPTSVPPTAAMTALMGELQDPFLAIETSGLLSNPWTAAALRRNELRNASVLRWFLDPRSGHGCGDALLVDLLARIGRSLPGVFPTRPSAQCTVTAEECPDGDRASRVDLQIDDPKFFLVVEVKIDAPEQLDQIRRYCDVASARTARARPWGVVFLTTDGREPSTARDQDDRVVSMSWSQIAASLRRAARDAAPIPRFLAASFATHIASL